MATAVTAMIRCICGLRRGQSLVYQCRLISLHVQRLVDHQQPTVIQQQSKKCSSNNDHPGKQARRPRKTVHVFKRMNWESLKQFGPMLRQHSQVNAEVENRKPGVTVISKESGFKYFDIQTPRPAKATVTVMSTDNRFDDRPLDVHLTRHPLSGIYADKKRSDGSSRLLPLKIDSNSWPTVTRILQATMSSESLAVLEAWKNRMIAKLGEDGFERYQQEMYQVGIRWHKRIEDYLSGSNTLETLDLAAHEQDRLVAAHWTSLSSVLPHVSDVVLLETRIQHPRLCYTGVVDCVAKYRGTVVLIEWKTAQRPKMTIEATYDNPLQAVAYLGALRAAQHLDGKIDGVLIVVASAGGHPAHAHYLNEERCMHYWALWLQRLLMYHAMQAAKTASTVSNLG